jgi:hypothetical protein
MRRVRRRELMPRTPFRVRWALSPFMLIACAAVAFTWFTVPAAAASDSVAMRDFSTVSIDNDVCDLARQLTDDGQPQEALDLIDRVLSAYTQEYPVVVLAPTDANCLEEERLRAAVALADERKSNREGAPTPSKAQEIAKTWTTALERSVTPWYGPALAVLGIVAGLLVIARLAALFPRAPFRKPDPSRISSLTLASVLVIVLSTIGAVTTYVLSQGAVALAGKLGIDPVPAWQSVLYALGAVGATMLLARALASRLRIEVQVRKADGADDAAATSQLAAYTWDLGGHPPEGFDMPVGTDVQSLSDSSVVSAPQQKVVAFLLKAVQSLFGTTPWKATVDLAADEVVSLRITRNGWTEKSLIARPTDFDGLPDRTTTTKLVAPDMKKMAAAAILVSLSERYDGFAEGLAGATRWQSVGLHYIATSEFGREDASAIPVLANALNLDPRNRLARLALRYHQHRFGTQPEGLTFYAAWLRMEYWDVWSGEASGSREEWLKTASESSRVQNTDLKRRLLCNYVIAVANLRSISGHERDESNAASLASELQKLLQISTRHGNEMRDEMQTAIEPALQALNSKRSARLHDPDHYDPPGEVVADDLTGNADHAIYAPREAYNRACLLASQAASEHNSEEAGALRSRAVHLLEYAFKLPGYKQWAAEDPSLRSMRGYPDFDLLLGSPRSSSWDIEPFRSVKGSLEKQGIITPERFDAVARARPDLAAALEVPPPTFNRLRRISRILAHAPLNTGSIPSHFRLELIHALVARGVEYRPRRRDRSLLASQITEAVLKGSGKTETETAALLPAWRASVRRWLSLLPRRHR